MKKEKAITLISLVITIIILIILAGIGVNLSLGENGIFRKAQEAKEKYEKAQVEEEIQVAVLEIQTETIENNRNFTMDILKEKLPQKLENIIVEKDDNGQIIGEYKSYNFTITKKYEIIVGKRVIKPLEPDIPSDIKEILYLYKEGDECENVTNGWNIGYITGTNSTVGSIEKCSNYIEVKTWGYWCGFGPTTKQKIDVTKYSKLKIDVFDCNYTDVSDGYEQIALHCGNKDKIIYKDNIKDGEHELDISSMTGEQTIYILVGNGANTKIRSIWIET